MCVPVLGDPQTKALGVGVLLTRSLSVSRKQKFPKQSVYPGPLRGVAWWGQDDRQWDGCGSQAGDPLTSCPGLSETQHCPVAPRVSRIFSVSV